MSTQNTPLLTTGEMPNSVRFELPAIGYAEAWPTKHDPQTLYLGYITVAESERRNGYGRTLLNHMFDYARENYTKLSTEVHNDTIARYITRVFRASQLTVTHQFSQQSVTPEAAVAYLEKARQEDDGETDMLDTWARFTIQL